MKTRYRCPVCGNEIVSHVKTSKATCRGSINPSDAKAHKRRVMKRVEPNETA